MLTCPPYICLCFWKNNFDIRFSPILALSPECNQLKPSIASFFESPESIHIYAIKKKYENSSNSSPGIPWTDRQTRLTSSFCFYFFGCDKREATLFTLVNTISKGDNTKIYLIKSNWHQKFNKMLLLKINSLNI